MIVLGGFVVLCVFGVDCSEGVYFFQFVEDECCHVLFEAD